MWLWQRLKVRILRLESRATQHACIAGRQHRIVTETKQHRNVLLTNFVMIITCKGAKDKMIQFSVGVHDHAYDEDSIWQGYDADIMTLHFLHRTDAAGEVRHDRGGHDTVKPSGRREEAWVGGDAYAGRASAQRAHQGLLSTR